MTLSQTGQIVDFGELAGRFEGAVVTPSDPDWDVARLAWNLAADQQPQAVVVPRHPEDVAAVVRFARTNGLCLTAQGTGRHAMALGDLGDSMLVRTSALGGIDMDVDRRRVRVGAGETWGPVTAALAEHGLASLAGSAADVGVAGYLLGGGYSWLGREYGVASSAITTADLVTMDGEIRHVDENHDRDLFWALRGGGGNFGIVTAIEFDVYPVADVYAGTMVFPSRTRRMCWRRSQLRQRTSTNGQHCARASFTFHLCPSCPRR